jgi:hypothetical protein
MSVLLDRMLESCLFLANRIWWHSDHYSFRVVDGSQMSSDDYRAAGCMRLVRAAERGFGAAPRLPPRVNQPVVFRRGIAPPASVQLRPVMMEPARRTAVSITPARRAVAQPGG